LTFAQNPLELRLSSSNATPAARKIAIDQQQQITRKPGDLGAGTTKEKQLSAGRLEQLFARWDNGAEPSLEMPIATSSLDEEIDAALPKLRPLLITQGAVTTQGRALIQDAMSSLAGGQNITRVSN
jgi:hypothetical protein